MLRTSLAVSLLLLPTLGLHSQITPQERIPIAVLAHSDDYRGESFIFRFKEAIRASSTYRLAQLSESTLFQVHLKTTTIRGIAGDEIIAISAAWTLAPLGSTGRFYLDSTAGYLGSNGHDDIARALLARTDQLVSGVVDALADASGHK